MQNIDWILTRISIVNIDWILIGYWLSNHVKSSSNSSLEWQLCTWNGNLQLWLNYIYLASSTSNSFNHWIPFFASTFTSQNSSWTSTSSTYIFWLRVSKCQFYLVHIKVLCRFHLSILRTCAIQGVLNVSNFNLLDLECHIFLCFYFSVPISSLNFICCFSLCIINSDISKAHISIFSLNCNLQVQK